MRQIYFFRLKQQIGFLLNPAYGGSVFQSDSHDGISLCVDSALWQAQVPFIYGTLGIRLAHF
jgi:hypothetical protein